MKIRFVFTGLSLCIISFAQDLTVIFPSNLANNTIENNSIFWGLFYEDSIPDVFIWRQVEVKLEIFFSEIKGCQDTAYLYNGKEESLILIDNLGFSKNRPVKGKLLHNQFLVPGEEIEYKIGNTEYRVIAEADSYEYIYPAYYCFNYRYILNEKNELNKIYKLMTKSRVSYGDLPEAPTMVWIGDLDYDGHLDLITSEKSHYAAINGTVYITSMAQDSMYALKISISGSHD